MDDDDRLAHRIPSSAARETIGLNTRSMLALRRAGIDPSDWLINNVTGVPAMERLLTERLLRNNLSGGIDVLRITGAGPYASNLR